MSNSEKILMGDYELFYNSARIEVQEHKSIYAFINGTCIARQKIDDFATVGDLNKVLNKINEYNAKAH